MLVVNIRIVLLKIMLESVHVNQEQRAIHFWAVYQFNTAQLIINVHRERFVRLAFVQQFVHRIVNVSLINFACKAFANRPATTIQHVPNSNSVRITFVHKRFDAVTMMNVCHMNIVMWIHMVDPNVRMLAKDVYSVAEMQSALHVIMTHCVHANQDLLTMAKVDADESNVKMMVIAHRNNSARKISANWHAKLDEHVAKRQFVPLKIIDPFAIVNRATVAIHMNNVMPSIIAAMHHADQEHNAQTTREHSIALAAMDTLVIHTMKAVA